MVQNFILVLATETYGMQIREAFYAPRGRVLLSADYSQIELRILAHLSHDKALRAIFENNEDIHTQTASQLFDVALDRVTPKQRQIGKRINFSIMYGATPFGLSRDLEIKPSEAKEYIDKYFQRYPGVAQWMERTVEQGTKDGYVQTLMGRRRYVPGLRESNRNLYQAAVRMAVNSPVQGTQADLMKKAMIELQQKLVRSTLDAQMLLQIHDEVVLEVASDDVDAVKKLVKQTLEGVVDWSVPLEVTLRTGKNWADVTK